MVKENVMVNTEIGLLPEDWEIDFLHTITDLVTDGSHLSPPTSRYGFPIVTVENINKGYINFASCRIISEKDYLYLVRNNCKPINGDVLLSKDGTIGITFTIKDNPNIVLLSSIALIRPNKTLLNSEYLSQVLSSHWFYIYLNRVQGGSALTRIVLRDIKNFYLALPPLPEQEAIAKALSDADEWIESLEKLIAKKHFIKQGAMQELLRPKEDWEMKKLGEVALVCGGGTPSTFKSEYWNGNIEWFTPTEVGYTKYLYSSKRKLTNAGLRDSSAIILPINTILLTSRAGIGDLGILKAEAATNQGFQSLICRKEVYFEFLYYLMSTKTEELLKNASGSTFLEISPNKVKSIEVIIPSVIEQTRIATILSDMDTELEALVTQLEKARKIKQGMMQELLTGRTRLV